MDERKVKEELTIKLLDLGQLAHEMARNKNIKDEQVLQISNEICMLEKQLHEASGNYIPAKDEMKCPSCLSPHEEGVVFCGNCGQNIKEFYETTIDICQTCNSIVNKESKYCGVCGSNRNQ